ncbi:MAG: Ig-like domain-containing protein [Gemmatimonadales bacterium]
MRSALWVSSKLRAVDQTLRRLALATVAAAGLAYAGTACKGESLEPEHQHVVSTIALDQAAVAIRTGEQAQLTATAKCFDGVTVQTTFTWSSGDQSVASVTSSGLVTAVSFGNATVSAAAAGKSASAAVTVAPLGTVVGAAGGTVVSSDGGATLEIPAGALDAPVDILVSKADDAGFAADPLYVSGTAFKVDPATLQLKTQARLRIRFDPAHVPAGVYQEQLRVREREQTQWRDQQHAGLQGTIVDALIDGPGVFAIVVQPAAGTLVGPLGGTVLSADGNAELVIPAGAITGLADVRIEKAADAAFGGDALFVPGSGYEIIGEPLNPMAEAPAFLARLLGRAAPAAAMQLHLQAQLRIHYDPAQLPTGVYPEQLRIRERDQDQWRDCDHDGLQQQQRVQARVQRFGLFGLVVQPPAGSLIGPAGGTVVSADGQAELVVPAGALATVTDIVITKLDDAAFAGDPTYVPGTGYQIEPATAQLQVKARLRIRYDPAQLPAGTYPEQLRIRERVQAQWQDCEHIGLQQQMVEAWTQRLGQFGMVAKPSLGTLIGPLGGTAVSADGYATLVVPAGALSTPTDILVIPADPTEFADDPLYVAETAYQILPNGVTLGQGVELRIAFEPGNVPAGVDPDKLRIREREWLRQRWQDCTQLGIAQNVVRASVVKTGVYAILGAPMPAVKSVIVSPAVLDLEEGDVVQMTATVLDAAGLPVDAVVTWTSSDLAVATVDQTGLVTAVAAGSVTISASAGGVSGGAGGSVKKPVQPASITVNPASTAVAIGGTVQLTADVRDAAGNPVSKTVTWSSSAMGVATVSSTGLVTGISVGSATITARIQTLSASAAVTVNPPVSSVVIDDPGSEPVEVGLTKQLNATAYNASGQPVQVTFTWSSSDDAIASVDQTGLVTGVGRGTATITAAVGTASASVSIKVVGESSEEAGNNLSWPTVFVDGTGITGLAVATDPGVRPTTAEGVTADTLPFFWDGNAPTYNTYYEQQTSNTWRAELLDGTGQAAYDASAYWGDNITVKEWSATRPIRVEIALSATGVGTLTGFNMTYLYGEGPDEMQGTDGSTAEFVPLIYTVGPTITVEKLSGPGGSVVATVADEPINAEVNVGGRIIYGYQLKLDASGPGWYRLRYRLATGANARITAVGNTTGMFLPVVVGPRETMIEINVLP